jgi:hypothetical protein
MTFIIMHKTNAIWEAGALPGPEMISRCGALIGELMASGVLRAAEGLRPSSEGVRVVFADGKRTLVPGPFVKSNELPAAFTVVRAASLEEAVAYAARQADILGDVEIDIRPVNEPWDVGLAPAPADTSTRRYMLVRKATPATESGAAPAPAQRAALSRLIEETTKHGVHLADVPMRPSARGRRVLNSADGVQFYDGPFVETKELIGGFIIVAAASLDEASALAGRYIRTVDASEVDVRELE